MVTVLVTGSRSWRNKELVLDRLDQLAGTSERLTVVHGACPQGVDSFVDNWLRLAPPWVQVRRFPADPAKGRRGFFLRNYHMVHSLIYDLCLAFIRDASRGATMTMEMASRIEVPVDCYREWSNR